MRAKFRLGNLKVRDDPEGSGFDMDNIKMGHRTWIRTAQGKDYWQALVNTTMNLWVP